MEAIVIVRLRDGAGCTCTSCAPSRRRRRARPALYAPKSYLRWGVPVREGGWTGEAWCEEHAPKGATIVADTRPEKHP